MKPALADSFDYATLWCLLDRIRGTHRLLQFADLGGGAPSDPFCILRHDVDYTPDAALALAREEAARGIRATYFLLVNSSYYNLLSPSHGHVPAALVALGHEVGLHYDVRFLRHFPQNQWESLLDAQAALLERLAERPVTSIAMHQPGLHGTDPFRHTARYVNAYGDRFAKEMPYFSDSCRAWRDATWQTLSAGPLPTRFQLGLHPINWADEDRDRETIFRELHAGIAQETLSEGDDLMRKIAAHPAVLEHKKRTGER